MNEIKEASGRPRNCCLSLSAAGALLLVIGLIVGRSGNCSVMLVGCAASVMVVLLGLIGAGRCIFERRQRQEELQAQEFRRDHGSSELFEDADEAVRLASRANLQYRKYAVPVFTVLLGLCLTVYGLLVWRTWAAQESFPLAANPMPLALLSAMCWIGTLILGSYFIGVSREPGCRWVRPGAAWLFFAGGVYLLASVALFLEYFKKMTMTADITLARVALTVLLVLAIELLLAFVIEFYRPRMPGETERPLPESRLLALLTEPGGFARNLAASLDYQFGFRVSEAWFFRFLERTVVPLLVIMVLTFWLQTCLVVIGTGEQGLFERFGCVGEQEPVGPGVYLKLPWPLTRVERFPVEQIQEVVLGEVKSPETEQTAGKNEPVKHDERVILWSLAHAERGESYLVGSRRAEGLTGSGQGREARKLPPSALVVAQIPVSFRVRNLYDFRYRHGDVVEMLRHLGTREWIHYLSGCDFQELLGEGRGRAAESLRKRLQDSADSLNLGVEIVGVNVSSVHPPVEVGAEFDRQMGAYEEVNRQLQQGRMAAKRIMAEATSGRNAILAEARMDNFRRDRSYVEAEAGLFASQLERWRVCPEVFMIDSEMRVLQDASRHLRKYIVGGGVKVDLFDVNLEKRNTGASLLDMGIEAGP